MKKLLRPDQIKERLDREVIGQDEAKITLSVAVYNHYKRIRHKDDPEYRKGCLKKSNIILLGPSGCGKTHLVQTIADIFDVPFYIQDTTKLTASGYVGSDVEDCLVGLLRSCRYNIEKAQKGIIVLDEGDKMARKEVGVSITRDVSGECVQQSLLKIVEGDMVGVPPMGGRKHPEQELLYIDTSDILFIISGAFVGLDDIISRRIGGGPNRIGFTATAGTTSVGNLLSRVTPQDLRKFGLIPELLGRFPVITYVNPLERSDLIRILEEPTNSLTSEYTELMREDGIDFIYGPGVLEAVADAALALGTGARGLRSVMEKVMRNVLFDAPRRAALWRVHEITLKMEDIAPVLRQEYGLVV